MKLDSLKNKYFLLTLFLIIVIFAPATTSSRGIISSARELHRDRAKIGEIQPVNLEFNYLQEQRWIQEIHHTGATFIRVHFAWFSLSPGDYVAISDSNGAEVCRYPESLNNAILPEGGKWALSVAGETARIELKSQLNPRARREAASRRQGFLIDMYSWGFSNPGIDRQESRTESTCGTSQLNDAICYESSYPTEYLRSRAVALLLTTTSAGTFQCNGWRVGAGNAMLARQTCIANQTEVLDTEVWFNYQNNSCRLWSPAPVVRVRGRAILATDATLDFTLFSVDDLSSISGFGYLELDPRAPVKGEEIYIPQHSAGRLKQLSIESDQNSGNLCRVDFTSLKGNAAGTDIGYYCDAGAGSSGSPVLARSSHKVIALHHLGLPVTASCPRDGSNQGVRIDKIYPQIKSFVEPGKPIGFLDAPLNNSVVSGELAIVGWAALLSDNKANRSMRVELYVDGLSMGELPSGLPREDVRQYLLSQGITAPAELGFSGLWNSAAVADGQHRLTVRISDALASNSEAMLEITGVDIITVNSLTSTTTSVASTTTIGNSTTTTTLANATTTTSTTSTTTVPFFVGTPRGFLDSPADGSVLSGNALLGGWAAIMNGDTAGMASRVDLLVDGVLASIMNLGVIRQDVKQYFATQGVSAPDNLGFFGAWDSRTVFDGTHQLAIRAADSTGGRQEGMAEVARISVITSNGIQTTTTTTTITTTTATTSTTLAVGQSAHGNLESPSQGQAIFSSGTGSGWAFLLSSNTGMLPSRIDILADGFVISQATLGISRPDVRDHFATLGISVPPDTGFLFNWDRAWMPVGTRTLAVRAVDAVGNGTVIAQITVQVIESQTP